MLKIGVNKAITMFSSVFTLRRKPLYVYELLVAYSLGKLRYKNCIRKLIYRVFQMEPAILRKNISSVKFIDKIKNSYIHIELKITGREFVKNESFYAFIDYQIYTKTRMNL
jgi:hypothetical protein